MTALLQVYVIRHGETEWSLSGRHTGRTDIGLTANGEVQARALMRRLRNVTFARVFTSPSLRARQTCDLAGLGARSERDPDLAEWDYGDYEGERSADIRLKRPGWTVWKDGCPHGETVAAICVRADRLIERLARLDRNVALFTHGEFGAALAARWIGLPIIDGERFALHPASVSILGHEPAYPERRVIELWNEVPAPSLTDDLQAP